MFSVGSPASASAQIDAEDFEFAVRQISENLRVFFLRVGRQSARQMNRIAQLYLPGGPIGSWRAHISPHRDDRRVLEIEPAEDAHRIHRMQQRRLRGIGKRIRQIESSQRSDENPARSAE